MEISPWAVYLIMQLDTIQVLAFCFWVFGCVGAAMSFIIFSEDLFDEIWEKNDATNARIIKRKLRKWPKQVVAIVAVLSLFIAFVPSSKTAAAMLIIPAIVNNERVHEEAGEVYELAKQAMRDMVEKDDKQ